MNLGETIYQLRTTQNMSQGELADHLNLSRQSISKWENNSAVPDLDNLIKLSEIFGVSLDTLVKGSSTQTDNTITAANAAPSVSSSKNISMQKIIGLLLLCMSFISFLLVTIFVDLLSGLIIGAPFFAFSILCLTFKKHAGLACAWVIYVCIDLFLRLGSHASWSAIFAFSLYQKENSWIFIIAWILFLLLVILLILTIRALLKKADFSDKNTVRKTILFWILFVITFAAHVIFSLLIVYIHRSDSLRELLVFYRFLCFLLDYCRIMLFAVALTKTILYRRAKKLQ